MHTRKLSVSLLSKLIGKQHQIVKKLTLSVLGFFITALFLSNALAQSTETISIAGSSTVYPFMQEVIKRMRKDSKLGDVHIRSTGSGSGIAQFCSGKGKAHIDIAMASRRMKKRELADCHLQGVLDVIEVKIGYDGIVFVTSKKAPLMALEIGDLFQALAAKIPAPDGSQTLRQNPHTTWQDIHSNLPPSPIEIMGPSKHHGTFDVIKDMVIEAGCKEYDWLAAKKKGSYIEVLTYNGVCHDLRKDGSYEPHDEYHQIAVEVLSSDEGKDKLAIMSYKDFQDNRTLLNAISINNVKPAQENIADGRYPLARPLYVYVKKRSMNTNADVRSLVDELTKSDVSGNDGYLAKSGMISMPDEERQQMQSVVNQQQNLVL